MNGVLHAAEACWRSIRQLDGCCRTGGAPRWMSSAAVAVVLEGTIRVLAAGLDLPQRPKAFSVIGRAFRGQSMVMSRCASGPRTAIRSCGRFVLSRPGAMPRNSGLSVIIRAVCRQPRRDWGPPGRRTAPGDHHAPPLCAAPPPAGAGPPFAGMPRTWRPQEMPKGG